MVCKLNMTVTHAAEGVDESPDLRLGVSVCLQPPPLDDLGHCVDQSLEGGYVTEAEEHDDLGDCSCHWRVDVKLVRLELFGNVSCACLELFKS
jgi:hypothetical protein